MLKCCHNDLQILFHERKRKYEIVHEEFSWVSSGRRPYVILRRKIGKKFAYTYRTLGSALHKHHEMQGNAIISTYSGFIAFGKKYNFTLICTARITENNSVDFSLKIENETDLDIESVFFPAPFNAKEKCQKSYSIESMRQGLIIPDGHKKNFLSILTYAFYPRKINTGDCYMPFWGRVCDGNGYSAIVETPFDASVFSCLKKKAFISSVFWHSSLGKLAYERKLKFTFHKNCDYNTVAKNYRKYLIDNKQFITIEDKATKNPNIKKLAGCPILHCGIFSNVQPGTNYYKKGEENQKIIATFEKRAEQYKAIKEMGLEKLYIHTDGWGEMGYDNNHPYVLPPCPQAGGYDGMKRLSDTCRSLGYIFAIHDQYRDFYYSCKKFDENLSVTKIDGTHPYCDIWAGGAHTWLCATKALDFVKETYTQFDLNKVDVQGVYLDVFAVMPGDECFNPRHKIDRQQSMELRGKCFDYLNEKGIITSSEEPASQLINNLALVHHGPYALRPQEFGVAVGIPIPLANLVYHDCIMTPWLCSDDGGWGIPNGDSGKLHCILNAGMPYFEPFDDENQLLGETKLKEEIQRVKEVAKIQETLVNEEMVEHKFLDANFRKQQTVFANGTVITVDFDKKTYIINTQQ